MRVMRWEKVLTVLADSGTYLIWRQPGGVVVQRLDFLEQCLALVSAQVSESREGFTVFPAPSKPTMITENSSFLLRSQVPDCYEEE